MTDDAREKACEVCSTTLARIQVELQALSNQFSSLGGVETVKIMKGRLRDKVNGQKLALSLALKLQKNVRIVNIHPDERGFVPSSDERHVVEKGGMFLDIRIVEGPVKMAVTGR